MPAEQTRLTGIGRALLTNKAAQVAEFLAVAGVAGVVILGGLPWAGEDPLARQGVVWVANVLMLVVVWVGLRLRGQSWAHFGLSFRPAGRRTVLRAIVQSLIVFVAAAAAFAVGAVVMANIVGMPEPADMSGYDFLRGNLPLFLLCLFGVYIVSSFGEEVIYRAFLINRIAELGSGGKAAWRLAVVLSAIAFGLVHYEWGPAGIVQTGLTGLALGIAYLVVGRNLWVNILAHAYLDTALLLPIYFGQ